MQANKLQIKIFFDLPLSHGIASDDRTASQASTESSASRGAHLNFDPFVVVFHDWIRRGALSELVIDVADYSHVERGPGVVLVGHASDYYIDNADGVPGLLYSRKRAAPPPDERLKDACRRAVTAARLLEAEATLLPLKFRTNELLLRAPDRLVVSNDRAGFESVREELETFAEWLYPGATTGVEHVGTPAQPLTARLRASTAPELVALLERLGGPA